MQEQNNMERHCISIFRGKKKFTSEKTDYQKKKNNKHTKQSENALRIINVTTATKHSKHLVAELEGKAEKNFQKAR